MPVVTVTEVVPASMTSIYKILSDMQRFPEFMKNVESVTIAEQGEDYTHSVWRTKLQGATFQWTERDEFFPQQGRISYRQIQGDLKKFEGFWQLRQTSEGTEVTLQTDFEFGMPMLASLLNPVAKLAIRENAKAMVRAIGEKAQAADSEH
ncbi:MAG: cyclase [Sulfobacillus thermosulfidooxidans]|uniref:type II toxin-antitoxin system RatA family toxin n=1 Tax=Sulfobacillus sp. hq2 TaxID=2039167 RepID=UPI000CD0959B|nr:SRPBCC family protein [Sulfobacillus sp. hq2]POB10910.1 cyclase [Sulfobacillus sp. hq2]PSR36114.1 MAG: cyclase [Sulfobacillus thermosulfidooxidans]